MSTKHFWILGSICLGSICCPAKAADAWKARTFDMTYSTNNRLGPGSLRVASDGHAHGLMEINMGRLQRKYISDCQAQTTYLITSESGSQKAVQMSYDDEKLRSMTFDDEQKKESTALGAKIIAGHRCHGYRHKTPYGGVVDTWLGDDTGFTVGRSSNDPLFGVSTAVLQTYSNRAPAASAFLLPAGIKVVPDDGSYELFGRAAARQ